MARSPTTSTSIGTSRTPTAGFRARVTVLDSGADGTATILVQTPAPVRRLGLQLAAIVRAASGRRIGTGARSAVGCIRHPGRRPCEGFIMVFCGTNRRRMRLLDKACTALEAALAGE